MSRIGNKPISITNDVSVKIKGKNLEISGKNGSQSFIVHENIKIDLKDDVLNFSRVDNSVVSRSMHGTTRQIVNNMIIGVTEGFKKELDVIVKADRTSITVEGNDKQLVGSVASKIRSFRKPEPYKGKGVRYKNEHVRIKQGKTVGE